MAFLYRNSQQEIVQPGKGLSDDQIHNSIIQLANDAGNIKNEIGKLNERVRSIEKQLELIEQNKKYNVSLLVSIAAAIICLFSFCFSIYSHFNPLNVKTSNKITEQVIQKQKPTNIIRN